MARQKGTANFSGTLEVLAGGPIDSRTVVPTLADLTVASNFPYAYVGLETYVVAENKKYRLIAADVTQSSNWEEVGSGGGGGSIDVDDALSSTSENPVQNKVVKAALDSKVNAVNGKGLSTNDYTTGEKNKLAGLSNYDDTTLRGLIAGKQDQLTAGNGIDITNNVISAGIPIVANQFEKSDLYSTTEKVVGCWTDGRPIYQKVIVFDDYIPAQESTKPASKAHGINNLDFCCFIGCYAWSAISGKDSYGRSIIIPSVQQTSDLLKYQLNAYADKTNVYINTGDWNLKGSYDHCIFILKYTKTTDAANSFKYADENDYSTTEHIVGSWIDGKPVYQKTISKTGLSESNPITINFSEISTNLKLLIKDSFCGINPITNGSVVIPAIINPTDNRKIDVQYNGGEKYLSITSDLYSSWTVYATFQYTKTTD